MRRIDRILSPGYYKIPGKKTPEFIRGDELP